MPSTVSSFKSFGHVAHFRDRPGSPGPRLTSGDRVTWTNPATGAAWPDLVVEFVYPALRLVLLRGHVGRISIRHGGPSIETIKVRIDQVALQAPAAGQALDI
jgi:hypothetical protein